MVLNTNPPTSANTTIPSTPHAQHSAGPSNVLPGRPHGRLSLDRPAYAGQEQPSDVTSLASLYKASSLDSLTGKDALSRRASGEHIITAQPMEGQHNAKDVLCRRRSSGEHMIMTPLLEGHHTVKTALCRRSSGEHMITTQPVNGKCASKGALCRHVSRELMAAPSVEDRGLSERGVGPIPSPFLLYSMEGLGGNEPTVSISHGSSTSSQEDGGLGDEENGYGVEAAAKRQLSKILCMMSEQPLMESASHRSSKALPPVLGLEDLMEPPEASDFDGWPDAPVLLRPSPGVAPYQVMGPSPVWNTMRQRVQGNTVEGIEVETPLFKGRVLMLMDGLKSTPAGMFNSKKRKSWLVVQGKFKQELSFDDLVSGQEFKHRLENLPSDWFVEKVLFQLARNINGSMVVGPLSKPSMVSPVVSLAQIINVAPEDSAPDPLTAEEDMRIFDPALVDGKGNPMNAGQRRKHFARPQNRAGRKFDTRHVWTFHVWQQFVDMSKYQLDLGITKYSLIRHLAGQPLQFSFKHAVSGQHLFSFDIWHESLL